MQVAFPAELDVYDFCTPELQQQLQAPREAYKDYQDKLAQQKRTAKQLKTEDGPKPGPGAAEAEAAAGDGPAAAAAGADVEMHDAEAAGGGASSSSAAPVVGALTGGNGGYVVCCCVHSRCPSVMKTRLCAWHVEATGCQDVLFCCSLDFSNDLTYDTILAVSHACGC